ALRAIRLISTEVTTTAAPTERATRRAVTRKIRVASDGRQRRLVPVAVTARGEVGLAGLVEVGRNLRAGDLDARQKRRRPGERELDRRPPGLGLLVPDGHLAGGLRQAGEDEAAVGARRREVRGVEDEDVGHHALVDVAVDAHQAGALEGALLPRPFLEEAYVEDVGARHRE